METIPMCNVSRTANKTVESEKDLGVVFSNDLKVRRQCEEAYGKGSQMLGLINRTIQFKNPIIHNK